MPTTANTNTPRVSIVIPTYTRHDKLKICLESILKYTDMTQTEIVVVANGMPASSESVVSDLEMSVGRILFLEDPRPLGYPKAVNMGIREARGEFIILLNDDTELLPQPINEWVDTLMKPMLEDGAVGVAGPLMEHDPNSNHDFLIFFCVMVRRKCFDEVGLLDEGFKYFGEDTAFCIEAERKGWKVIRVPEDSPTELKPLDPNTTTLETWKHDKMWTGNFRIFHDAESTIGRLAEADDVLRESRLRLKELYGNPDDINIHRAMVTDGWIAHDELVWLARAAKACGPNAVIVQVGVWHGKSSRAISDNMCEGSKLFDCDTFNGSSGEPDQHATAKEREGDHCFQWYWDNQYEQILKGEVIPLRMHSENASHTLAHRGIKADMIFIDADHAYEGVRDDIDAWLPLLKEGGLICGHDFYKEGEDPFAWMGVRQAVLEKFPHVEKSATSIWHVRPSEQVSKPRIVDAFLFSNELDVLEIRLATLYDHVDRFVLVESPTTHAGRAKPLHFDENKERFTPYLDKITHIITDLPTIEGTIYDQVWARERAQRDACLLGLRDCQPNDIVIIGDADEIVNPAVLPLYQPSDGIVRLKQRMFYYFLNCENKEGWDWQKLAPYSLVKELTPCGIRYPPAGETPMIENGGWHFSFCGNAEHIKEKLRSYSHQEFNTPAILDDVEFAIHQGRDLFGRDLKYEFVGVDEQYPLCVKENVPDLVRRGLWRTRSPKLGEVKEKIAREVVALVGHHFKPTVTACVSTKDRYTTTLPLTLSAIINQTQPPDKLKVYDDGEQLDLRESPPFDGLLRMADQRGIKWEVLKTPRQGQVGNHQHCLDNCETTWIWRVDDDEIPEPNCLQVLLETARDYGLGGEEASIGAVAGLVHNTGNIHPLPSTLDGSLNDIALGANIQWFEWQGGPRVVEHLYSTFLYRVEAGRQAGGYCRELSPVGHREESIFTHAIHRAGFKLLMTPHAKTWHLQGATGGIRSYTDSQLWVHDEEVWQRYLKTWGVVPAGKLILLDAGLGDHLTFKAMLPEIRKRNEGRKLTLAVCFPDVFEGESDLTLISIAEAKALCNDYESASLYAWMWRTEWKGSLPDAMVEFWS